MDTDFEDLRRQYRAEAIQACKLAEQRGYEKGVSESISMTAQLNSKLR